MMQRLEIDSQTTLERMEKKIRRIAVYLLEQSKKDRTVLFNLFRSTIDDKTFAYAMVAVKEKTLRVLSLENIGMLVFEMKDNSIVQWVDDKPITVGVFDFRVSRKFFERQDHNVPSNLIPFKANPYES